MKVVGKEQFPFLSPEELVSSNIIGPVSSNIIFVKSGLQKYPADAKRLSVLLNVSTALIFDGSTQFNCALLHESLHVSAAFEYNIHIVPNTACMILRNIICLL